MLDINKYLKELRKKRGLTLREVAEKSGLSHSYISSLESGVHPKSKAPIKPSPESLKRLSVAFNHDYDDLMVKAGYIDEQNKESAGTLPESVYDEVINETEKKYNVNLRDDPFVLETMRQLIESYAKSKMRK